MGSNAAKEAARTQAAAADRSTQTQLDMYGQTVGREHPFVQAGTNALTELQRLLGVGEPGGARGANPILAMLGLGGSAPGIDPKTFVGSPGYQYQVQQGENAITNAASRTGGLGGNALRALQQNGQGLANQSWSQFIGMSSGAWENMLKNLSGLVQGGQSAAANLGGIGTRVAEGVGSNMVGAGNALAGGIVGSSKALEGGLNNGLQGIQELLLDPEFQKLLKGAGGSPSPIALPGATGRAG